MCASQVPPAKYGSLFSCHQTLEEDFTFTYLSNRLPLWHLYKASICLSLALTYLCSFCHISLQYFSPKAKPLLGILMADPETSLGDIVNWIWPYYLLIQQQQGTMVEHSRKTLIIASHPFTTWITLCLSGWRVLKFPLCGMIKGIIYIQHVIFHSKSHLIPICKHFCLCTPAFLGWGIPPVSHPDISLIYVRIVFLLFLSWCEGPGTVRAVIVQYHDC